MTERYPAWFVAWIAGIPDEPHPTPELLTAQCNEAMRRGQLRGTMLAFEVALIGFSNAMRDASQALTQLKQAWDAHD